ncbi:MULTISPECIES: phosphoglycerate dehydrogenase [Bacillaceae]|uniref:D-3-phosphoglycerate dehydrogenase n=1 Tax=Gottfriedia luciferensis TaxID=178774 RepID=A0ABX2ZQ67_9BACI|nr:MULTISPECIES: phosphoglycerate dehydrogenase [Bacillaceae]ODG91753.1 3-phosphoglycerate dehydrogenase [Gottfriedia luciferensis]PGZ91561.1 3-phosphoglycerate dehydrogenase [Bacillus sp. AFS029533]SFD46129.1 D-3-phosphoglycerate dehydrogenase [Bacillus sp. UNCCL81]
MIKIQTLNNISEHGIKEFPLENYSINNQLNEPDGILLRSHSMHEMNIPNSVKAIARAGAGVNNIPIDECTSRGIVVFNTPGANANAVKELVLTSLFLSSRRIIEGIEWTRSLFGEENVSKIVEAGKKEFAGAEIAGKKLGIIGLGAIGALVANDALALDMEVYGYDPYISVETAWRLSRNVQRIDNLEQIFSTCDYITIHVPLTPETKAFVNEKLLSGMKKGSRLLNFSRSELVDDAALEYALNNGTVGVYVTDFPNEKVIGMKNVIPIPHLGASTAESEENCARMAAKQLKNYLETGNIKNSVNFPNVELPYTGKKRITIAHKNIPNMVGQITGLLANYQVNIADMLNRSKGAFAYTMIDLDETINGPVEQLLKDIEGVISVRII